MLKPIVLVALLVVVRAENQPYEPRGWRPSGRPFEPARKDYSRTYGSPPLAQSYGYPIRSPTDPESLSTTTIKTPRTTTSIEIPTATTPRSREPTTSRDFDDQDYDAVPALAVANSFAFNRPVYVYNTFPFHSSGLRFVK